MREKRTEGKVTVDMAREGVRTCVGLMRLERHVPPVPLPLSAALD